MPEQAPLLSSQAASEAANDTRERLKTRLAFGAALLAVIVLHATLVIALHPEGGAGYFRSVGRLLQGIPEHPVATGIGLSVILGSLAALYWAVTLWRHPAPKRPTYLPYPPLPQLVHSNDIYVGSGWTREGKQPGALAESYDEPLFTRPHVVVPERGLFGNIHVTGGIGGGKTTSFIMPFLAQGLAKFPKPMPPDESQLNPRTGKYTGTMGPAPHDSLPMPPTHAELYGGLTAAQARARYQRLMRAHQDKRWGMFIIDPKGDMTDDILRLARLYKREDDVRVLEPGGRWTINPLATNPNALVQAERVLEGVEATSGQVVQAFWRSTQVEWLTNALSILRVVDPKRANFRYILQMARSQAYRLRIVSEAQRRLEEIREEEARLRQVGKAYVGPTLKPEALEFFKDFDSDEANQQLTQGVLIGIKAMSKYFVDAELIDFLCPEQPPTFEGYPSIFNEGRIVVLKMPPAIFGPVGETMGILALMDAQDAARERMMRPDWNQDRVAAFVVDEIQQYFNKATTKFVSVNRQARVVFAGSHQTQGQLEQAGGRGGQQSFNDNLRTKIAYSTTTGESAEQLARLMGKRRVFVQQWSENQDFRNASPKTGKGPSLSGANLRVTEMERPWFDSNDFLSLQQGEFVVREFDGNGNISPRRVFGQPWYLTRAFEMARQGDAPAPPMPPHPVVRTAVDGHDETYLSSGLAQSGYAILLPLADASGDLRGWQWITPAGTFITALDTIERLLESITEFFTAGQQVVISPWSGPVHAYFEGVLGLDGIRPITPDALELPEDAPQPVRDALRYLLESGKEARRRGSWEEANTPGNAALRTLERNGRAMVRAYEVVGRWLDDQPGNALGDWMGASLRHTPTPDPSLAEIDDLGAEDPSWQDTPDDLPPDAPTADPPSPADTGDPDLPPAGWSGHEHPAADAEAWELDPSTDIGAPDGDTPAPPGQDGDDPLPPPGRIQQGAPLE